MRHAPRSCVPGAAVQVGHKSFANFNTNVHFHCANSMCIEKVGLCNRYENCGDGSDEAQCTGSISVFVESTRGCIITVETPSTSTGAFHDRKYVFGSPGYFSGKAFIKNSNDDRLTDTS